MIVSLQPQLSYLPDSSCSSSHESRSRWRSCSACREVVSGGGRGYSSCVHVEMLVKLFLGSSLLPGIKISLAVMLSMSGGVGDGGTVVIMVEVRYQRLACLRCRGESLTCRYPYLGRCGQHALFDGILNHCCFKTSRAHHRWCSTVSNQHAPHSSSTVFYGLVQHFKRLEVLNLMRPASLRPQCPASSPSENPTIETGPLVVLSSHYL